MSNWQHQSYFHDLRAFDFPEAGKELPGAGEVAWRIAVESYDSKIEWQEEFARFLDTVDPAGVRALIVGSWKDPYDNGPQEVVRALVAARDRFPALRALFVGDITSEECEISWITHGDMGPLLDAFPALEEFGVRGGGDLDIPVFRHENLRTLRIETGGLAREVVRNVAASDLPGLELLDIWLGTDEYGANTEIEDLAPFLAGTTLPKIRHLALRNSDLQDRIAAAMASAPVVARLSVLDLSMGILTDEGAEALLNGQPLTHLTSLRLWHHWMSEPMVKRLEETFGAAGVHLDVSEGKLGEDDDWRYTAVAE
jgi:hypothetical protein